MIFFHPDLIQICDHVLKIVVDRLLHSHFLIVASSKINVMTALCSFPRI